MKAFEDDNKTYPILADPLLEPYRIRFDEIFFLERYTEDGWVVVGYGTLPVMLSKAITSCVMSKQELHTLESYLDQLKKTIKNLIKAVDKGIGPNV